jgi:uncharacterized repeat protein (TIGR01451 family)
MSMPKKTWFARFTSSNRKANRARLPRRKMQLTLETLENRVVPTTGAFLQGTAYVDVNNNHVLDAGDTYLAGATVTLYQGTGTSIPLATAITDANGAYLFQDSTSASLTPSDPGVVTSYGKPGLNPGQYTLVETHPAGYANNGTQVFSQLNPMTAVNASTIQVTVLDPASYNTLVFNSTNFFNRNAWDFLGETFHFGGATVATGSPTVLMSNTNPLVAGESVTITAGSNTLSTTILSIVPNMSITLAAPWTAAPSTSANVDHNDTETAGQFPVSVGTVQAINAGVTNGSPVVTVGNTTGFSMGELVNVSDAQLPSSNSRAIDSTIVSINPGVSITLANAWPGLSGNAATIVADAANPFLTLCWDLQNFLGDGTNIFAVTPVDGVGTPTNAGEIAYLYNHYGSFDILNTSLDNAALSHASATPPALPLGTAAEAVGLQVAIWQLEYGIVFSNLMVLELANLSMNPSDLATELANVNAWESFYLNDAAGKSERATFLQVSGGVGGDLGSGDNLGQQGMIATGSGDFGNVPGAPRITTSPSTTRVTAPDVDVLKTPDETTIQAGQQAGFTIRVYNEGTATATGVTVNDPLPAGLNSDINWSIDSTAAGTNPTYFTITGAVGSQVLTLSSTFNGAPTNDSLAPGQSISVHIVGLTTQDDVAPPAGATPASGPAILPGTELTSSGTVAVDNGHQNVTPESQAPSRPEITVTNLSFKVQPGYTILLENSVDTSIPEAGPPPGKGVSGVPSAIEFARVADWSDVAVFANITDSTGTHGVVYWCSAAENNSNQDIGTPLDTILANVGSSNPGLAAPKATDNVVFLVEREAGRSGDNNPSQLSGGKGGGQSNPNNSYLTNNITYNLHSDPPASSPQMVFTGTLTNTVTVNAANESAAERNDHATATITITTATTNVLPDVDVAKIPDQTSILPGATAGYTVLIYNVGGLTAMNVTLSDPLPAGANNDINWMIDTSTGNFAAFTITGAVGNQTLSLNPGTSLSAGGSLTVHVTGQTSAVDTGTLSNGATVNASNEAVSEYNATAAANITVGANTVGSAILNDTADLEGGNNPTGTITFTLYAPDNSVAFTQMVTVNHGNGLYSTSNTAVATQGGTYQWVAVYGGDPNNQPVSSKKGDEPVVVTGSPDVDVLKTPDQATIIAGTQAGFTVTVTNEGNATATGVTLTDPLPAGLGNDINWMIDPAAAGTSPGYFTITGAVGSQVLTLSSAFNGPPTNDSLAAGQSISVHIVGLTSVNDVPSPISSPTPAPAILPGTELTSSGTVAVDNGHQNVTPESQAGSRPEMTVTDLSFRVQPGFIVLLEQTIDTRVPEAGPPPGKGVSGVASATEFGRTQDWSDVAIFANTTDSTGTHGRVYWMSDLEDANNQDTGTPLDNILANIGPANPGLSAPTLANTVFLVEREAGRSGDNNPAQLAGKRGGGESNPNNSYLTGNITYNLHSDPPAASPVFTTGQLTNTATVTASNETGAEKTDTSTATITITAAVPRLLPDVDVQKVADAPIVNAGATAGFTVTITNEGNATATGLTLSDLLPAGLGNDINWKIDTTTGNPTAFTITGAVGSQNLSLNSGISLAPGTCLELHITGVTSAKDAPAPGYSNTLTDVASVSAGNAVTTDQNDGWISDLTVSIPVAKGDAAAMAFWQKWNGAGLIQSLNGGPSATNLAQWLVANFPNLYGPGAGAHSMAPGGVYLTNAQVAKNYNSNFYSNVPNKTPPTDADVLATALAVYATSTSLAGGNYAASYGLNTSPGGVGLHTYNVGTNGATFDVPNNSTQTIMDLLWDTDWLASATGVIANASTVDTVFSAINTIGHVNATLSASGTGYKPDQVRTAYGINNLTLDGTGQTIAVVDAYDTPTIFLALDTFDQQFGTTSAEQSLYQQYGPASSFLTVLNQDGQAGAPPMVDPSGAGTNNWEGETELDVEWIHAVAPGVRIILVEANSQSLADLMAAVGTAAQQPGVSVVSMSWGFTEGLSVVAQDEALYDQVLTTPAGHQGVTFVASTGDYGSADPEYPAFSPNVLAVGGTSLYLNADNSYKNETAWGYNSAGVGGLFVGTGGGVSQFEAEPAWQTQVQGSGYRTTPDVSFIADPATGVYIADPYNLDPTNPWEVVGGTSLSAPSWAGLIALVNQGRVAAGKGALDVSGLSAQQALYSVSAADFTDISSGTNGDFNASPGYDVVTGLGSPQVTSLIPDLISYSGRGLATNTGSPTYLSGYQPRDPSASLGVGVANFSVFSFETAASLALGRASAPQLRAHAGAVMNSAVQFALFMPVQTASNPFASKSANSRTQPTGAASGMQQTSGSSFTAAVLNASGDSGQPTSSWAAILEDARDRWLLGLRNPRAMYQEFQAATPARNALDEVFRSEQVPPARTANPAAQEGSDSSSAETAPSALDYGWWQVEVADDEADSGF